MALMHGPAQSSSFPQSEAASSAQAGDLTPAEQLQLANCRAGLIDPQARPAERQRWAELLFTFSSPPAKSLIIEMLERIESPAAQQAIAEVITNRARLAPESADPEFIPPLMNLLSVESEELRTAAARALAEYGGTDVPARLGAVAAAPNEPMTKRLAAIDALASQVDRREVIAALIPLLDSGLPEVRSRVIAALEPASRQPVGADIARWKEWWAAKARLTHEQWLADRVSMYRERLRSARHDASTSREESRKRSESLTSRLGEFQREVFRMLPSDQQEARLAAWLDDPLAEVKLGALAVIQARIADEGRRPNPDVLGALLKQLRDPSPLVRRQVLLIVQTLNDPTVVKAVLAQLEHEKDLAVRHAIFKALGRLNSMDSVPALVQEIAAPESDATCVEEAAIALGQMTPTLQDSQLQQQAVAALQNRYQRVDSSNHELRAALLSAMAGVGDESFGPAFLEAVDSTHPTILRSAIRGLRAINNGSKLPRLRALMSDADPLVRLAATEAVARLGREVADLESLMARQNPAIESNELVREAAWRGTRDYLARRPTEERIQIAQRLRDLPDLEIRYLEELASSLAATNGGIEALSDVYDRLATVMIIQNRFVEAAGYLRRLYELKTKQDLIAAQDVGLRWLEATLLADHEPDIVATLNQLLHAGGPQQYWILDVIAQWFETPDMLNNAERSRSLLAALKALPADSLGESWRELLDRVEARWRESNESTVSEPTSP